ncbi:PfkB family carbohydrate kinase, partial [Streptomyces sp. NPDC055039]
VPGFPVEAVDSNGAGDAHVGAFLALLGQGHEPLTAARGANAAAAYAVGRRGPATAPDRTQLAAFLGGDPLAERLFGATGR